MLLRKYDSRQNTLGAAENSGSFWDIVGDTVKTVTQGVTQYQFNKQSIQAGNSSAANYTTPGAPVTAGGGFSLTPTTMLIGAAALGVLLLAMRKRR